MRGVKVTVRLGDPEAFEAYGLLARTQPERRRATVEVRLAGRLAAAAGLDPRAVYRSGDGTDRYTAALAYAGERVDIRRVGYDVVVSAPKSVSVPYDPGAPAVAERVRNPTRSPARRPNVHSRSGGRRKAGASWIALTGMPRSASPSRSGKIPPGARRRAAGRRARCRPASTGVRNRD